MPHGLNLRTSGFRLLFLGMLIVATLGSASPGSAADNPDSWAPPTNLSQSGSATNPVLVKDASGTLHLIWEDKTLGFMASEQVQAKWTSPVLVAFPWGPRAGQKFSLDAPVPFLIGDRKGFIFAFWIDAQKTLFSSWVNVNNFLKQDAWSPPNQLASSVLNLAAAVDDQNQLHLIYIQQKDTTQGKAGIYYTKLPGTNTSWSKPIQLYTSAYIQNIQKDQSSLAIATGSFKGNSIVYAVWDNQPLKRVFLARSADEGKTWDPAKEIDGPGSTSGSSLPYNIIASASGNDAVLVWQTGQPGISCRQVSRATADGGSTWDQQQTILAGVQGCPSDSQFIDPEGQQTILASTVLDQVYLQAWDGTKWSNPQLQSALFSFINPVTFATVNFRCRQFVSSNDNQLFVVGCDGNGVGDIWLTSRKLDTVANWFQASSAWSNPIPVTSSPRTIGDINLVSAGDRDVHAIWTQADPSSLVANSIYYSHWNGDNWSSPISVLKSPTGNAYDVNAALGTHGRLFAAWSSGSDGKVYVSWSDASRAMNSSEWTAPVVIAPSAAAGSSPEIRIDSSGTIYIAYAVPFNEGRGIYLVSSKDDGTTWSAPIRVFDAAAAGWSQVDLPHLSISPDGQMEMIWTQLTLPGGGGPIALYFSRSQDSGKTWDTPKSVVDRSVVWSKIIAAGDQTDYLAWIEKSRDQYTVQFTSSRDGGSTWDQPSTVATSENLPAYATLQQDPAGQLHIVLVAAENTSSFSLEHWGWDGSSWSSKDTLQLNQGDQVLGQGLAADISPTGSLDALYQLQVNDPTGQQNNLTTLNFSSLSLNLPAIAPTPTQTAAAVILATSAPIPTIEPTATITPTLVPLPSSPGTSGSFLDSTWGGLTAGGLLATAIVAIGVGFVFWTKRYRQV